MALLAGQPKSWYLSAHGSDGCPFSKTWSACCSESLDYEPIQNKLFYDRMKSRKEGKKKLYGSVPIG